MKHADKEADATGYPIEPEIQLPRIMTNLTGYPVLHAPSPLSPTYMSPHEYQPAQWNQSNALTQYGAPNERTLQHLYGYRNIGNGKWLAPTQEYSGMYALSQQNTRLAISADHENPGMLFPVAAPTSRASLKRRWEADEPIASDPASLREIKPDCSFGYEQQGKRQRVAVSQEESNVAKKKELDKHLFKQFQLSTIPVTNNGVYNTQSEFDPRYISQNATSRDNSSPTPSITQTAYQIYSALQNQPQFYTNTDNNSNF